MEKFKIQFEVRFGIIIDFKERYKEVISTYIQLNGVEIGPDPISNGYSEKCSIIFKEALYIIDLRWDRLIIICEGNRDDLYSSGGPFFIFFGILEKIIKLSSGGIKEAILAEWCFIPCPNNGKELSEEFASRFFSSFNYKSVFQKETIDSAISLEYKEEIDEFKLKIGPFNAKKDVINFNLNQVSRRPIEDYNEYYGFFVESIYYTRLKECDLSIFKKMDKFSISKLKKIYGE